MCDWYVFGLINVEGDNMHMPLNSASECAESLNLITFVVFLFPVIENCKPAQSERKDNIDLCAVNQ